MFYLSYMFSELRRRKGRTLLTALGLGVGVGLVVAVTALSQGLNDAQDEVLEPLTGVGTDMSVTRPLQVRSSGSGFRGPGGAGLSEKEQDQLREENGTARFGLADLGKPGEKFSQTNFVSTTQLSFPAAQVENARGLDGVADAAGSLTLSEVTISGRVPKEAAQQPPRLGGAPGTGRPRNVDVKSNSITGVDPSKPALAAISPEQIASGSYFDANDHRQMVVNVAYAKRSGIELGDKVKLKNHSYTVVGLSRSPLGGEATDFYIKLDQLQALSDRKGRINTLLVRAGTADDVAAVERAVKRSLAGASVTTSTDLAERVGGSLVDAKNLASKLGGALTIVALVAAVLIASLLTLASVTKRIRELGTLKALGWGQAKVVRQVTGESLVQGALGGVLGALLGIAAAAAVNAIGITLKATVAAPPSSGGSPFGPVGFGQGQVTSGSTEVALNAPVDFGLVLLAISLAVLGGLVAGSVGGLRAARLRPADALRHID